MSSSSSTGGAVISAESDMPVWAMDNSKCAVCGAYGTLKDEIHVESTAIIGAEQLLSGQIIV